MSDEFSCPKCESTSIESHGKKYAVYPAGCLYLLSLPFAALHQLQLPTEFRCKHCGKVFRARSLRAKVFLWILFIVVAIFLEILILQIWFS